VADITAKHADKWNLFLAALPNSPRIETSDFCLDSVPAGNLQVASGKLIVVDPIVDPCDDGPCVCLDVPNGDYPVFFGLVRNKAQADERITLARLQLLNTEVTAWRRVEGALIIDGGYCGLMDRDTCRALEAKNTSDPQAAETHLELLRENYRDTWSFGRLSPSGQLPAALCFSSGVGDGVYPVYVGLAGDDVAAVLVDFAVLSVAGPDDDGDAPLGPE
jgi:hypothetical protein